MPKNKKASSDSDSGPDDRNPKKSKSSSSKTNKTDDEEDSWTLTKNRFVKLRNFKGKYFVDIREFYFSDDGEMKPGKKGISLPLDQWQKLKGLTEEIDSAIKKRV